MDDESEGQKVEPHSSTASRNLLDVQAASDRQPLHDTPTQSQSESFITTKGSRYKCVLSLANQKASYRHNLLKSRLRCYSFLKTILHIFA